MAIYEVLHTCPCGMEWTTYYEGPAIVDPTCPQCERRTGLIRVGSVNHNHLEEQPTSTLRRTHDRYP